jgi:hypothetical protein
LCPHYGRTSRSNKKSSLKTWRSPSSTSKYCVDITASRTDKDDDEVNEGEDKGRTDIQKSRCSSHFPFHGVRTADETKLLL